MRRYIVWHLPRVRGDDGSQGPVFYADHDYYLGALRLYARQAPDGDDLKVDIRDDGVTVLNSYYATLNKGDNLEENAEDYPVEMPRIEQGSVISFHIISTGGAEDITAQLEMESLDELDEDTE